MKDSLKKILFIDDDQDLHVIVSICLRDLDAEVRSAFSGEEGIKLALDFQPDLILLDVMMPEMDGMATLEALRLIPSLKEIPVIFVTAKAQKDEVAAYEKCGVAGVIVKPFDAGSFSHSILQIWNKIENT